MAQPKNKIILISPTSDDFRKPLAEGKSGYFFPTMGLMLVAQTLKNADYDVVVFDGNFDANYKESIFKLTNEQSSNIVCIGFYLAFLQIKDFVDLMRTVKSRWPQITTLVGGPFPSVFPEMTAEYDFIDIVCWGDGAQVSVQIADCIREGRDWSEIPNICFKKNGAIQKNPKSISDSLHKDNYIHLEEFLNLEDYVHKFDVYLGRDKNPQIKRAMPLLTGLGCSYKCTFCEHALMGNKHHALQAKDIVEQMNFYYENYNVDTFAFFDEEFLSDKERIFELTGLLRKNKHKFSWGTQVRASDVHEKYIDKDRLKQIEESGCIRFSMGIESGSPRMLKKIKKGLTPELVTRAANFGKDSKIVFSYSFIVNLPTETNEELQMTIDLAKKLLAIKSNSFVSAIHHYFAYPGTPLAIEAEERSGYRIEENFSLESFANIDMPEYSQKVNPTKMDSYRESKIIHFEYSVLPFDYNLNAKAVTRNLFKIIGNIRELLNFYGLPFEINLRNLYLK